MTALISPEGIITRWPKKQAERKMILSLLASKFEPGRIYKEMEVNDILRAHHSFEDWALLRREMYEASIFDRDPKTGTYWLDATPEAEGPIPPL